LDVKLYDSVAEFLPIIDYLTVHTPLTDATRNLISDKEIDAMKEGACLINCARGGIYNMDALVRGLDSGKLGGVALDVYPEEPYTESPLFGRPNVVCTPHLGASTAEAQMNVALEAVELLIDYLKNGVIRQAVNFSSLDPKTLAELHGSLDLAYRLGVFAQQVAPGAVSTCKIEYKGELARKNTTLVTSAFCSGYLTGVMGEEISVVSAAPMMQERGLKVVEEKCAKAGDFSSVISIELETDKGSISFAGALFGGMLGFLVYNWNPARIFMGDTGSLFLGGMVTGLAFLTDNPLLILVVGLIYIIETVSVILQVGSYKLFKKRIFKMAPIHHHFEKCGWGERKIVTVAASITAVLCVIAYILFVI
jgi:D-3-phosphoglycerate dehydrogenase